MNERSSAIPTTSSGAILSIRLWIPVSGGATEEQVWKKATPAAAVAWDLVEASGGAGIVTEGNLLTSNFPDIPTAILAAKRIQWAVSGCAESGDAKSGSAAILIRSALGGKDQTSAEGSALQDVSLEQASPGQILLSEAACLPLENLPGLPLGSASAGVRELQWRRTGEAPSVLDEDSALSELIREHGLEGSIDPEPEMVAEPIPVPAALTEQKREVAERVLAEEPEDAEEGNWVSHLLAMPLWLKLVSGALPVAIVVALVLAFSHGKAPANPPVQPSQSATPVTSQPVTPAGDTTTGLQTPTVKPAETSKTPHETKPTQPAKAVDRGQKQHQSSSTEVKPTSACTLTTNDISFQLGAADASFQSRQYKDAERRYRSVLACEPDNRRAITGLERASRALQLQSSSN